MKTNKNTSVKGNKANKANAAKTANKPAKNGKKPVPFAETVKTAKKANKPAKTAKTAKANKPERKQREPKAGLVAGQTRVLLALSKIKGKGGLTCGQLAEEHPSKHEGWTRHYLGSDKAENREMNRKYLGGKPTLYDLKAIEMFESTLDSRTVRCYRITAKGREVLKAQLKLDSGK